jgi:membrane associated rhomboid family serine protease
MFIIVSIEIYEVLKGGGDGIGHIAHLGGGLVGVCFYFGDKWLQKNKYKENKILVK